MTSAQIDKLISKGAFPESTEHRELVETHISWVILCDRFVYKIKKPIKYSFLDFSTLELRRHFCERELELNQRYSQNIYLEVLPIYELNETFTIGKNEGTIIDYTLKMHKFDPERQMDVLVSQNKVSKSNIKILAERIADFHKSAKIINETNIFNVKEAYNDLRMEKEFLSEHLGIEYGERIDRALETSETFLQTNKALLLERLRSGFFRDCHGDLHTRNIFLLPEPQLFDCIEFNDEYRQIDVLNEVAFLCMDLDALDKKDLSDLCIDHYNIQFATMRTLEERKLFTYYKSYRANVRAKVNCLRAKSASNKPDRKKALDEAKKYLLLMEGYLNPFD